MRECIARLLILAGCGGVSQLLVQSIILWRGFGTVVSGRKPIDGLGQSVSIGIRILTDISKTCYPGDLKSLPLVPKVR